uniref:hypothetical protein n=1 Tax=Escherichia coli TaxID=562 RepID=UPI001F3730B1|nr:hypothetical protein [Escherichia coli]UGK56796.1 hypothetical protein [Escherichia coli]
MAADNSARAIFIRGLLLLGMMLYLIYSLGFQNTDELKQQITQEVNASRSLISNDRWLSVIANSEATLSTLINDYKLIDYLNTILIPDTSTPARGMNYVAEKMTSVNYTVAKKSTPADLSVHFPLESDTRLADFVFTIPNCYAR